MSFYPLQEKGFSSDQGWAPRLHSHTESCLVVALMSSMASSDESKGSSGSGVTRRVAPLGFKIRGQQS